MIIFERLVILGVGLMGGSLALAAKQASVVGTVVGWSRTDATLQSALANGVIDEAQSDLSAALADADCVVVATPTTKIEEFLDPVQFADDIALLKQFRFEQGQLVIHTDPSVMPPKRKDWSVLSYMMDRKFTRQQFTVWLNSVEPSLVGKNAVFQTWQPVTEIDPKKVISTVTLTRAVVDSQTVALNKELQQRHKSANRKVFFCGSWSCDGLPILESAVTSAMHIAEIFGAPLPFVGLKPKVEVAPQLGY